MTESRTREEYLAYMKSEERINQAWSWILEILATLEKEAGPGRKPDALRFLVREYGKIKGYIQEERMCETFSPGTRPWHAYQAPSLSNVRDRAEKAMEKILAKRGFVRLQGPDLLPELKEMADIYAGRKD